MTEAPDLERWLPNGFPPPSFVVETERVAISDESPPLQNRLLVGGAILGAVLLVLGLVLMASSGGDGGDDDTALRTAPSTGPTSTIPELSFPPADFEGSFLVPDSTVPLPTLPVVPQTPIFVAPPAAAPARPPARNTTQTPTTEKPAATSTVKPVSEPPNSTSTMPTTTAAPLPPKIERVGDSFVQPSTVGDRCSGGLVSARVTDATLIRNVMLTVFFNEVQHSQVLMKPENDAGTRSGVWTADLPPIGTPSTVVRLSLEAENNFGQSAPAGESFSCP